MRTALIAVDPQFDFMEGGKLPSRQGTQRLPALMRLTSQADVVVVSRDLHPPKHVSFSPRGQWPEHCVLGTAGALVPHELAHVADVIVTKGSHLYTDAYSAFEGYIEPDGGLLSEWLRHKGVKRVLVAGYVAEHCVRATALDAVVAGFNTVVVPWATADISDASAAAAYADMEHVGVHSL